MAEEIKCPHCGASIEDVVNDEKIKRDNLKDLYKRYCDCRDQELKRFWENSKYVWTFLAICFAGYGVLLTSDKGLVKENFTILSIFDSLVGIILSYLWLKMTQASKNWYEVYEMAIWEIESYANQFKFDKEFLIHNFWVSKNGEQGYSPSKIMILIGKLLIGVWCITFLFSVFQYNNWNTIFEVKCLCFLSFFCLIAIYIIWNAFFSDSIISSSIRTEEEEKIFKKIKRDIFSIDEYVYFEIKKIDNEKYVVFKFSEKNIDFLKNITQIFKAMPTTIDGFDIRYKFSDINNYYQGVEEKEKQMQTILPYRIIMSLNANMVIYTSDINDDFEKIQNLIHEDENNKIVKENNKIIIPLDCIKTN